MCPDYCDLILWLSNPGRRASTPTDSASDRMQRSESGATERLPAAISDADPANSTRDCDDYRFRALYRKSEQRVPLFNPYNYEAQSCVI